MARPKGSKTKKKAEEFVPEVSSEVVPGAVNKRNDEPEFYDPNVEKGEPPVYETEKKAEVLDESGPYPEDIKARPEIKPGPGEKLFESPGGCIHIGPEGKDSVFCKEEGIKIRPKR